MKQLTLKDEEYCCGCSFLEFDRKRSTPSRWVGEGYYVHQCLLSGTPRRPPNLLGG